jgi:hypothetical protein
MKPDAQTQTPLLGVAPGGQAAIQVLPIRLNPFTQVVQADGLVVLQVLQGYEQSLQTPLTGTACGLAQVVQKLRLLQV